jgi:hypothetical protein
MGLRFDFDASTLARGLETMAADAMPRLLDYAKTKAPVIEAEMKGTRPWTDQTGAAKAELRVSVSQPDSNTVRMTLAHGVKYGIWLELANEKNFAIIEPTLQYSGPEVIEDLKVVFGT